MVRLLLAHHANVNTKNDDEQTPLHVTPEGGGHNDIAQLLLAAKADVDARDKNGKTPWQLAAERGNKAVAVDWLTRAAEMGNAQAMNNLALAYSRGELVPKDDAKAAEWYRKAADAGFVPAMSNLAFSYLSGTGLAVNEKEARRWLKAAAEKGDDYAKKWLAEHPK
jgi:TPR repeat protein